MVEQDRDHTELVWFVMEQGGTIVTVAEGQVIAPTVMEKVGRHALIVMEQEEKLVLNVVGMAY